MKREEDLLSAVRKASAHVLAFAVKDLFPHTLLLGGGVTSLGFYYDFAFPFHFQDIFLQQIEDRMLALIREKQPICVKQMVPFSAKELFTFHGERFLAMYAEASSESLLSLFQMGSRVGLFEEEESIEHTGLIRVVKLLESEDIGKKEGMSITRIYGTAFLDKKGLKDFLKKYEHWPEVSHMTQGKNLQLFFALQEELWGWMPRGVSVHKALYAFFCRQMQRSGFLPVQTLACIREEDRGSICALHGEVCRQLSENQKNAIRVFEGIAIEASERADTLAGLFLTQTMTGSICHIFCLESSLLEECISYLLFMSKIFKILGFEFDLVLLCQAKRQERERNLFIEAMRQLSFSWTEERGKCSRVRLEWRVRDSFQRRWNMAYLEVLNKAEALVGFSGSAFVSLERWVALMLERGELPFWVCPEQVRVLPVNAKLDGYAQEIAEILEKEGFRVVYESGKSPLSERVHQAMKMKVPFLAVVGEKEASSRAVVLRRCEEAGSQSMQIEEAVRLLESTLKGSYYSEL